MPMDKNVLEEEERRARGLEVNVRERLRGISSLGPAAEMRGLQLQHH